MVKFKRLATPTRTDSSIECLKREASLNYELISDCEVLSAGIGNCRHASSRSSKSLFPPHRNKLHRHQSAMISPIARKAGSRYHCLWHSFGWKLKLIASWRHARCHFQCDSRKVFCFSTQGSFHIQLFTIDFNAPPRDHLQSQLRHFSATLLQCHSQYEVLLSRCCAWRHRELLRATISFSATAHCVKL